VVVDDRDDARAVGSLDHGHGLGAALLHHDVARVVTEAIDLVVPDDRRATLADDRAIGFPNDRTAAFHDLFAFLLQLFHLPQWLPRCADGSRRFATDERNRHGWGRRRSGNGRDLSRTYRLSRCRRLSRRGSGCGSAFRGRLSGSGSRTALRGRLGRRGGRLRWSALGGRVWGGGGWGGVGGPPRRGGRGGGG